MSQNNEKINNIDDSKNDNDIFEKFKSPFVLLVVLPILLFSLYQLFVASERFESRAQLIVQQPNDMATMDTSMAFLSGFGLSTPALSDAQILKAFIHSEDMVNHLDQTLELREHYNPQNIDVFSKLNSWNNKEDFLEFYKNKVIVEIDDKSSVITLLVQGFSSEYAHKINQEIVKHAEWYINSIGHRLANEQLKFINGEHQLIEQRLDSAKKQLLSYQQKYNLLDPEAEGLAFQQITYSLESKLAIKKAELNAVSGIMTSNAPQVLMLESQVQALQTQLENERSRLSLNMSSNEGSIIKDKHSISEILSRFTELKIELELALQAYTASQVSLEKSRIEAYRQLKYLMTVESPTYPESNQYPDTFYNITLFSLLMLMLFSILRIILSVVEELK